MFQRVLAILTMIIGLSMPVFAQDAPSTGALPLLMLQQQEPTHPERILMAFHKLAGIIPNFDEWASKSPFLKNARGQEDAITARENNRLRRLWGEYDAQTPIVVHINILLDEYSTIDDLLTVSEFTPQTFFSYKMYGENVAIVPRDIASLSKLGIPKSQMEEMLKKARSGQVTAELILKPAVADGKAPFVQNGASYWLLLAEIGEMRFWSAPGSSNPQLLWMYRADWYKPKEDSALMKLKGQ